MGRNHQFVPLHDEVGHRNVRHVEHDRLPRRAIVVGEVHTMLCRRIQEPASCWIFAHGMHIGIAPDAEDDLGPGATIVCGLENVRGEVVEQRLAHRDVGNAGAEVRRIDLAHPTEVGHLLGRHVGPGLSPVAGDVYQTIIRARPDHVDIPFARAHRKNDTVHLGAIHVARDRAARLLLRLRRVTGEVAAQHTPRLSSVHRAPEALRRHEQHSRVQRRKNNRVRPLPALLDLLRRLARVEPGIRIHFARHSGAPVELVQIGAVVRAGVEEIGVARIGADVAGLSATCNVRYSHAARRDISRSYSATTSTDSAAPAAQTEGSRIPVVRNAERGIVLLRPADVIRDVLGGDDVVKLLGGERLIGPAPSGVRRYRTSSIIRHHEMRRIVAVDPEIVKVAVRSVVDRGHRLPRILRPKHRRILHVDHVLLLGIGEDVRVVEGPLANVALVIGQYPRSACIIAFEQAPLLVLDQRIDPIRVGPRHGDTDASHQSIRHSRVAGDLDPAFTTVGALEQAASRPSARHLVFLAVGLPERGIHDVRIVVINRNVDRGRLVIAIQHLPPRLPAVDALEDAPLFVRHAEFAEGGDEDDVGIGRMNADLGDPV